MKIPLVFKWPGKSCSNRCLDLNKLIDKTKLASVNRNPKKRNSCRNSITQQNADESALGSSIMLCSVLIFSPWTLDKALAVASWLRLPLLYKVWFDFQPVVEWTLRWMDRQTDRPTPRRRFYPLAGFGTTPHPTRQMVK